MLPVIYDIGANNGCNLPYYLAKAGRVVAVEANPTLCGRIRETFHGPIASGHLIVVNAALVDSDDPPLELPFYVNVIDHVRSQLPPPAPSLIHEFEEIRVKTTCMSHLIAMYGSPFFIKLDVEGYDHVLLRSLFRSGICPPYISAECHRPEVFALLAALGPYRWFKFVDGLTVPRVFDNYEISGTHGRMRYTFPPHSAGPFGEDLPGQWLPTDEAFRILRKEGLGWKDLHAKRDNDCEGRKLGVLALMQSKYYTMVLENAHRPYLRRVASRCLRLIKYRS